jgi:dihydrofolate synthase / folylpolyglutamate synthase
MTVGLAFQFFADKKVDIAIIEVGMGGRLDATNIITPLISVITNIGKDHTQFLGNTLQKIAFEKGGIIKPNIPVVIGEYTAETKSVFLEIAKTNNCKITIAQDQIHPNYPSSLLGDYQINNKKTVIETFKNLPPSLTVTENHIKNGILNVVQNTNLKGRWQIMHESPKVICDTAHNAHGLEIVMKQVQKQQFKKLHIVLGVVNDKDLSSILPLFPTNAKYYFCAPKIERGLNAKILQTEAKKYDLNGFVYNSISIAYKKALANAHEQDLIYVGGSTFVVAEII